MKKYEVLFHEEYSPETIKADHVNLENGYTEFIHNHVIVARFYQCIMWKQLDET
jgi:hypothetical protein